MSRKQKIIISITGIILVSLILIGLTYAYFLTKITGNTNEKSISVSTANLILEYGENTNVVQGINNAEPGYSVEKIFTATNKGNSSVTYGAALESIVNGLSRQEDLVYTLTCTSYLKSGFSLSSNGTITGTVDGTCSGVTTETKFPSTSTLSIMTTNTIDTTHTHAYKLTVTYKEMGVDQSEDMNKTYSAKVNIVDLRASADKINPYSANKQALNYKIINNALEGGTNKTIYGSEVTTFTSVSGVNDRLLNNAPDDYGTSYYYRGNVTDNYVSFADKLWRIVRINGDGTIKLVLVDAATDTYGNVTEVKFNYKSDDNAYAGYMYGMTEQTEQDFDKCIVLSEDGDEDGVHPAVENTTIFSQKDCESIGGKWAKTPYDATHVNVADSFLKFEVDYWYETNIVDTNNDKYVADTLFCNDKTLASNGIGGISTQLGYGTNETYYASIERLMFSTGTTNITISKPTFKCAESATNDYSRLTVNKYTLPNGNKTNGDLTYPVGLLTADEVAYAGAYKYESYLYNSNPMDIESWLLTPGYFDSNMNVAFDMDLLNADHENFVFHPVLNLKSNTQITSGDGTKDNPYIVE